MVVGGKPPGTRLAGERGRGGWPGGRAAGRPGGGGGGRAGGRARAAGRRWASVGEQPFRGISTRPHLAAERKGCPAAISFPDRRSAGPRYHEMAVPGPPAPAPFPGTWPPSPVSSGRCARAARTAVLRRPRHHPTSVNPAVHQLITRTWPPGHEMSLVANESPGHERSEDNHARCRRAVDGPRRPALPFDRLGGRQARRAARARAARVRDLTARGVRTRQAAGDGLRDHHRSRHD